MLPRLFMRRCFSGVKERLSPKILRRAGYEKQLWKNGLGYTHEIAICKSKGDQNTAPFTWRLSMADLTPVWEGAFSQMSEVDRTILLLEGDCKVQVNGAPPVDLQPFQSFSFPGDVPTVSTVLDNGRDLNCMVDRGCCSSTVHVIAAGEPAAPVPLEDGDILFVTALGAASTFQIGSDSDSYSCGESYDLDKEDTLRCDIAAPCADTQVTVSVGRVVAFVISHLNKA